MINGRLNYDNNTYHISDLCITLTPPVVMTQHHLIFLQLIFRNMCLANSASTALTYQPF